jgi:hypothetical protein
MKSFVLDDACVVRLTVARKMTRVEQEMRTIRPHSVFSSVHVDKILRQPEAEN